MLVAHIITVTTANSESTLLKIADGLGINYKYFALLYTAVHYCYILLRSIYMHNY